MSKKQVLVLSLSALIALGGLTNGGIVSAEETKNQNWEVTECTFEDLSFEDYMKDMPTKDIPKDDMKKLKNLYDESVKLEKDNKFDEAEKKWDDFYKILDKYFDKDEMVTAIAFEDLSFEDFMKDMPTKDIPKDDMKKLKSLYEESVKLEKDNKFDEAEKKWDDFYKILDKYFDEDEMVTAIAFEDLTFEDFMKDMPTKDIPEDNMKKLKSLYEEVVKLEKDDKLDEANKKWDDFWDILDKYFDKDEVSTAVNFENLSFEDLMKDMPTKDIPKDDMKKLKSLYEESIKLEKNSKLDETEKKWDEFYEILGEYFDEDNFVYEPIDYPTFKEYMEGMSEDISKDDMKKLEELYNDCVKLEKEDKFDEAYEKWDEFCKILDKYFDKKN